jgi:adenylate cyclase
MVAADVRKLATIMFTDMVGYSALTQQDEALALELLEEHRQLLRPIFASHSGREIEAIGDGFFVEFPSALDAARCALGIQQTLADRNRTAPQRRWIEVRIGLHLGDVVVRDGRVHGDGVNIAARIEPLATPGGICLSEDVARQIQNKVGHPALGATGFSAERRAHAGELRFRCGFRARSCAFPGSGSISVQSCSVRPEPRLSGGPAPGG